MNECDCECECRCNDDPSRYYINIEKGDRHRENCPMETCKGKDCHRTKEEICDCPCEKPDCYCYCHAGLCNCDACQMTCCECNCHYPDDESESESESDDSDSESEEEAAEEEEEEDEEEELPKPAAAPPDQKIQEKLAACDSLPSYKIFAMDLKRVTRFELLKIFIEDPDFQRDLTKVAEMIVADRSYDSGTRLTMMELIHAYNLDKF